MEIIDKTRKELKGTNTSEIAKQEDLDISLYVAIDKGDLRAVDAAIESGANVNSQGCASNKKEHRFITNFSPLATVYNQTSSYGQVFSKSKRAQLIDIDTCFFIADLLNKTKDLSGLLHKAVAANNLSMFHSFLIRGVDVNEIYYGNSPLHEAVENNAFEATKKLLEAGASLTQKNKDNLTAFDIAIKNNYLKLATYLTKQLNYSSWEDSAHRVQVDISNQLFRIANLIEIYLYANVLQDEEDEEDREDEDYE